MRGCGPSGGDSAASCGPAAPRRLPRSCRPGPAAARHGRDTPRSPRCLTSNMKNFYHDVKNRFELSKVNAHSFSPKYAMSLLLQDTFSCGQGKGELFYSVTGKKKNPPVMNEPGERRASSRCQGQHLQTHDVFQTSSRPEQAALSTSRLRGSLASRRQRQGEALSLWSRSVPGTPLARKLLERGDCALLFPNPSSKQMWAPGDAVSCTPKA